MAVFPQTEPAFDGRVPVWDAAVRFLHWLLAALVFVDLVLDDGGWLHRMVGYAAAGSVCIRLLWAVLARRREGVAELKPSLAETVAYLRGGAPRALGHDPLGLWMVWLLWCL